MRANASHVYVELPDFAAMLEQSPRVELVKFDSMTFRDCASFSVVFIVVYSWLHQIL